jgi:hypothetical protein
MLDICTNADSEVLLQCGVTEDTVIKVPYCWHKLNPEWDMCFQAVNMYIQEVVQRMKHKHDGSHNINTYTAVGIYM